MVEFDYKWVATSKSDSFGGTWGDIGLLGGNGQRLDAGGNGWVHRYVSGDVNKAMTLGNTSATKYCQVDWLHVKNVYDYGEYLKDNTSTSAVQVSITNISNGASKLSLGLPLQDTTVNPLIFKNANGLGEVYLDNIRVYTVPIFALKSTSVAAGAENVSYKTKTITATFSNEVLSADAVKVSKKGTDLAASEYSSEVVGKKIVISFTDDLEYNAAYEIKISGIVDMYEQNISEVSIPFTVQDVPEIRLNDLRISKGIGSSYEQISEIESGNGLQAVSLSLENTTQVNKNVNLIFAFYDGDTGRFEHVMMTQTSISGSDTKTITMGTDFSMSKGDIVKAFVWEGFSTIKPWIDAIQMEIK